MENQPEGFGFNVLRVFDSVFFVEEAHNPKAEDVEISYGLAIQPDTEGSWVQYNIRVDFSTKDTKVFATGTVVTKFGIQELKQYIIDESIIWPPGVLEAMFSISFSHTRALMAKNMAPTKFSKYIVPLINHVPVFNELMKAQPGFEGVGIKDENQTKSKPKLQKTSKK